MSYIQTYILTLIHSTTSYKYSAMTDPAANVSHLDPSHHLDPGPTISHTLLFLNLFLQREGGFQLRSHRLKL